MICYIFFISYTTLNFKSVRILLAQCILCLDEESKLHFVSRLKIKPIQNSTGHFPARNFRERRPVFRSFHFRPFLMWTLECWIQLISYFVASTWHLVNIYNSLILPYITYGLLAWGNASNCYLKRILVLQKQVLRFIYFIPLFAKPKILPVKFLYCEAVSKLMFDVRNQSAPNNILKLFTKTSHIHTYNTRSFKSQLFSTVDLTYKKGFLACWCQNLE